MKIRIKFAKYGAVKYIGHLDVMRFFQKAIRRAGIDIKYSEGFSPHQIMSFAAPLGVGMESMGEYLDIEVNSMTSTKAMKDALNAVTVDGIDILSVNILPDPCKNAMASVAAASYIISYDNNFNGNDDSANVNINVNVNSNTNIDTNSNVNASAFPIDDIENKLVDFYSQEQITVTKKTKKSEIEVDLKPGIYEIKIDRFTNHLPNYGIDKFKNHFENYEISQDVQGKTNNTVIYMLVNASSSGNIKPSMVLDAFCSYCGIELPPCSCQITRLDTYTSITDGNGEEKLCPLEDMGHD